MRDVLKFKRKKGEYKFTNTRLVWETQSGIHYVCYPFMIYKDSYETTYRLTHMSSGALICSTTYLHSAKYIASSPRENQTTYHMMLMSTCPGAKQDYQ